MVRIDLVDRMVALYRMKSRTKKWTLWTMTVVVSWLEYLLPKHHEVFQETRYLVFQIQLT